ncbi:MAG: hypothetical protein ACRDI2_17620, partial [Chloroflexota bacterium]
GFGRLWVSVDGPFNEHLIRDVGGLTLGLAAVALFAFVRPTASMVRAVATGSLVFGLPHFVYHLAHLDLLPTTLDQVSQTSALAAAPLVALALLREAGRLDATTSRPHSEQEPAPAGLASQPEPASPTPVLR